MAAKEKKGLGTGLGILFGEEEYNDENELRQLSVTKLVPPCRSWQILFAATA